MNRMKSMYDQKWENSLYENREGNIQRFIIQQFNSMSILYRNHAYHSRWAWKFNSMRSVFYMDWQVAIFFLRLDIFTYEWMCACPCPCACERFYASKLACDLKPERMYNLPFATTYRRTIWTRDDDDDDDVYVFSVCMTSIPNINICVPFV